MIYRTRKPACDGWYWVRWRSGRQEVVQVQDGMAYGNADWSQKVSDLHRQVIGWAGPIEPPVDLGELVANLRRRAA